MIQVLIKMQGLFLSEGNEGKHNEIEQRIHQEDQVSSNVSCENNIDFYQTKTRY